MGNPIAEVQVHEGLHGEGAWVAQCAPTSDCQPLDRTGTTGIGGGAQLDLPSHYLQETGSLRKVFNAFRNRGTPDDYVPARERAVRLLEGALGASIAEIESRFMAWAPAAFDPNKRFYAGTDRAEAIRKELPAPEPVERQLPDASIERQVSRP
jgi:hypothetical protein